MKLIRKTQKTSCSKENQEPKHSNYSDLLLKKLREQHVENQNKNFPIGTTSDINYRRNSSFFFSILTHTIIEKNEQVKLNQKKKNPIHNSEQNNIPINNFLALSTNHLRENEKL